MKPPGISETCEHGTPRGQGCWMCENTELNRVRALLDQARAQVKQLREALVKTRDKIVSKHTVWLGQGLETVSMEPEDVREIETAINEALAATAPKEDGA